MHSTKKKVVIIGAGIAGLSAAEHLHSNGFNDVIVLEASDRIGGRIKSVKFGEDENAVVELGANYIEGLSLSSSIITLINEKCPESIPISADRCVPRRTSLFYRSDGRPIDPDMSKKMFGVLEGLLAEESEGNPLIEDFARAKLEKFLLENGDEYDDGDAEDIRAILNFCLNYCKNVFGGPLEDLPLKTAGADHSDYIPGGSLKVAGMSKVVEVLAERIPAGAIKLKSEVSKISTKIGEVIVKTADGTSYTTEHVIITCPLGFLKENAAKMFNPPLPAEKMEAIDKISFGKIGKVFLHYKNPFWTKGSGRVSLAWTNDDFCMKTEKQWYKNIEVFDEAIDNDNVLVCWVCYGGVDAIETMDEEQLKLECTAVLRKFLQNPSIPVPEKVMRSGWASDRLFRGTYCYKGVATTQKHLDDFEAPIIEGDVPRLMFAGEAIRCNGCIHGARDSGLREAEKLLRLYNFQRVPNLEF